MNRYVLLFIPLFLNNLQCTAFRQTAPVITDKSLFAAIDTASETGNITPIKEAFAQGASTNARDETDSTPLLHALRASPGWATDHLDTYKAVALELLQHTSTVTPDEFNEAVSMSSFVDLLPLIQVMRPKIADINAKDRMGNSALMASVWFNKNIPIVRYLIEQGADPNAIDQQGFSILADSLYRAYKSETAVAHFLLEHGAHVTPDALIRAARSPDLDLVKKMLASIGNVNVVDQHRGITALQAAIESFISHGSNETPHNNIISYLLDQGADVNYKPTLEVDTPIFRVIDDYFYPLWGDYPASLELIELLLKHGAVVDARTQALIDGNYEEVIRLTEQQSPELAAIEKANPQPKPDPAKKEQVLQLLAKYKKDKELTK